eukprot:3535116-Ditylum_brightwellii.AAC.1
MSTSYNDIDRKIRNDVTLLGIFESDINNIKGGETFRGIPINSPAVPAIVPRFKTLKNFTDRMEIVLEAATGFSATLSADYQPKTSTEPASFIIGIAFEKNFMLGVGDVSFDSTLSIGDLAAIQVQEVNLGIDGNFAFETQFGVLFAPDDKEELRLVGQPCDGNGPTNCTLDEFNFQLEWEFN